MEWDDFVEFQVVGDVGVGGARIGWIGFNAIDSSYGDIRLAAATAAGLSIDNPIHLCALGLSKVPIREVVATADVVVVLGEGAGVENAFHGLALPCSHICYWTKGVPAVFVSAIRWPKVAADSRS